MNHFLTNIALYQICLAFQFCNLFLILYNISNLPGRRNSFPLVQRGYFPVCAGGGPEKAQSGLHGDNGYFRGGVSTDGLYGRGRERFSDKWDDYRQFAGLYLSVFPGTTAALQDPHGVGPHDGVFEIINTPSLAKKGHTTFFPRWYTFHSHFWYIIAFPLTLRPLN